MALQLSRGYASNVGGIIALSFTVLALGVQPLYSAISSKSAYAASYVGVDGQTHVDTAADLQAALDNPSVTYITLDADMTTSSTILLSRSGVRVNGNDKRITYTGDTAGWQGHYVVQAYNVSNVEINSLRVSGGDAGFLINSSQVTLKGNTHVDNNEFGGIEVSRSSNHALPTSALTLQGALWNETYTEANGKPSVWVVNGEGTLDSSTLYQTLVPATHIKADQTQYYLRAQNTGTVATNTTQRTTYTSLAAAVAAASSGDTIELNKDTTLDSMVFLDKSLTLDGKGHTVTAPYSFTTNGVDNAVLTITANNVTVKNLTATNTSTGAKPHGIVVQQVSGITLTNLSLLNGRAGMIVNASKVVASNITTSGNSWYGINVDRTNAVLTIKGATTHTEAIAIRSGDTAGSNATVVDVDKRYTKESAAPANGNIYVLDTIAPTKPTITAPGTRTWHKTAPITNSWTASTDANGIAKYQVEYIYDDGHTFAGGPYREVPGTQTSRTHAPATSEQGGVTIRVRAIDFAGNASAWSSPIHYYYDAANPATDIAVSAVVDGKFIVSGTATDNLALNRVYVQLVSRVSGQRCGGTTISLIGQGAMVNWSQQYDIATLGCPEGNYAAHVSVVDMAGNTSSAGWTDDFLVAAAEGTDPADPTDPTDPGEETPGSDDGTGTGSDTTTGGNNQNQGGSTSTENGEVPATEEDDDADANGNAGNQVFTAPIVALGDRAVLGDQDPTQNQPQASVVSDTTDKEIKGAADEKKNATFSPLGFAWYWWLLVLAAIAGLWWLLAALRRRKEEE